MMRLTVSPEVRRVSLAVVMAVWAIACGDTSGRTNATVSTPTVREAPDVGAMALSESSQLKAARYAEKEFLLQGTAQSYSKVGEWGLDGMWKVAPAARAPYTIRMFVRYPDDPQRFNGIVVVEWLNVSSQAELSVVYGLSWQELIRQGYAYAGVGPQSVGINGANGLKKTNEARYNALQHPGDAYSYDIYSQAGQVIRAPGALAPLGALTSRIRYLVATGESQSASRLATYVNAVHSLAPVYDGFFIHSRPAGGAPLEQPSGSQTPASMILPDAVRIRGDLEVPVFQVETEYDVIALGFVRARQPDDNRVRTWELSGTSHADLYMSTGGRARPSFSGCDGPDPKINVPINDGPMTYSMRTGIRYFRRWLETGTPPPAVEPLVMSGQDAERDPATGIALGGLRTPHIEVPARTLTGMRGPAGAAGFCRLMGRTDEWNGDRDPWDGMPADPSPTPEPSLSKLYGTRAEYLSQFDAALERAIKDGLVLQEDAEEMRADASRVRWDE